tara:strand:- start:2628 stop:2858 length:231 start_codon:yes stop_codon:yes gene_type:complete
MAAAYYRFCDADGSCVVGMKLQRTTRQKFSLVVKVPGIPGSTTYQGFTGSPDYEAALLAESYGWNRASGSAQGRDR